MADPVFDEDFIVQLLSAPPRLDTVDALQSGAAQALIDLHDRKVTRDEFIAAASPSLTLYGYCAKLQVLNSIKAVYDAGNLDGDKFAIAEGQARDIIAKQAKGIVAIVQRLMECPTSEDKVH